MKICVLGLGYIGLPTSLLFAQKHEVIGVDVNSEVVNKLNNGELPFDEPGLDDLFEKAKNNFSAKTEVEEADVFLIAVQTPLEKAVKVADLKYVQAIIRMVFRLLICVLKCRDLTIFRLRKDLNGLEECQGDNF